MNTEARIEKIENDVASIKIDIAELKTLIAETKSSVIMWVVGAIFLAQLLPATMKLLVPG